MSTISAPFEGCITLSALNGQPLVFTIHDAAGQRHQAGAWWTGKPGCEPTTHHQRRLEIDGGSENLRNPDLGEVINVRFDYMKQFGNDCGRIQIDIVNTVTDEIRALVINSECMADKPAKPLPPVVNKPPVVVVVQPPPFVGIPEVPYEPPPPTVTVVPEPTSIALLVTGLAYGAVKTRYWKR